MGVAPLPGVEEELREREEAPLDRLRGAGLLRRLVGGVEVVEDGARARVLDRGAELGREDLPLLERGEDLGAPLVERPEPLRLARGVTEGDLVERARVVLPVARDERDRRAPLEELERGEDPLRVEPERLRDPLGTVLEPRVHQG